VVPQTCKAQITHIDLRFFILKTTEY